jgi:hypothetical protein
LSYGPDADAVYNGVAGPATTPRAGPTNGPSVLNGRPHLLYFVVGR